MYKNHRRTYDNCSFVRTGESVKISLFVHFDGEYDSVETTISLEDYKQGIKQLRESGVCKIPSNNPSVLIKKKNQDFLITIHDLDKTIETICDRENAEEKLFSIAE